LLFVVLLFGFCVVEGKKQKKQKAEKAEAKPLGEKNCVPLVPNRQISNPHLKS
jgi:hypothetical protein